MKKFLTFLAVMCILQACSPPARGFSITQTIGQRSEDKILNVNSIDVGKEIGEKSVSISLNNVTSIIQDANVFKESIKSATRSQSGGSFWAKTYGGSGDDFICSFQQTTDGGYIVGSETNSFGAGKEDLLIIKLDSSGNVTWAKTYGGSEYEYGSSISQTKDGGYIVAGQTVSFGTGGSGDVFVLKLDSSGNIQWAKTYGRYVYSLQQTTDRGYIVGGQIESFGAGRSDVLILKLDSTGNIPSSNCDFLKDITSSLVLDSITPTVLNLSLSTPTLTLSVSSPTLTVTSPTLTVTSPTLQTSTICGNVSNQPIWPMLHYNAQHTGQCPYDTSKNNGTLKWKFKISDQISSSPVIDSEGTVYIGSKDGYLYALNPDGTLKWKFGTGSRIDSSPAISLDGTIYIGSNDIITKTGPGYEDYFVTRGYLYAIDPAGKIKWKHMIDDYFDFSFSYNMIAHIGSLVISNGIIYVSMDWGKYMTDAGAGIFCAINPDGTLRWRKTISFGYSLPAIGLDGTIYVVGCGGDFGAIESYLYAFTSDGGLKWKYGDINITYFDFNPVVGPDGTVYVVSRKEIENNSDLFFLSAVNPNGSLKWKYQIDGSVSSLPAIASDGTIYVGLNEGYLYAVKSDGTLKWKFGTGSRIDSSPAIAGDGTIYVGSDDGYLYAITPDGSLKWKFQTGNGIDSSPAIAGDGTVYVGSLDSYLYAIGGTELSCKIELRKNGIKIDKIDVGEGFDIVITNYTGNIKQVRFLSDEKQNGKVDEGFTWADWYDWNASKDDWDAINKVKKWSFGTSGEKEVWAEVKDDTGQTAKCFANISVSTNWSFAVITDLHIGYNSSPWDPDNDGSPEIDYCGKGWNDAKPSPDEGNYYITGMLTNAINTIIKEREDYNIKFVVVLGDISDTAERSEFYKAREILNRLNDPNGDGDTKDGIPYIPLIGNHDIWPYTQDIGKHSINPLDKGSDAGDRKHYADISFYANGDNIFRKIFWGEENKNNKDLIKKLFGSSWETTSDIEQPINDELGCAEYRFQPVKRGDNWFYDIDDKDCVSDKGSYYLQNYGFVYDNITFIALDLAPRLGEDPKLHNGNALPGAVKGGIATDHPQTLEFSREYFKEHQNKKVILFSHYSTNPGAIDNYLYTASDLLMNRVTPPDAAYWFGGHVHYHKIEKGEGEERYVILTEDVAGIPLSLLGIAPAEDIGNGTRDGRTIRIVQIKNGDIDFSTTIEPIYKTQCIITASVGSKGTISPSGKMEVNYGADQTFTITPNAGYHVKDVKVDGKSVGSVSTYTFTNVTSDHTIEAIFEEEKKKAVIILQIDKSNFTVNGETRVLDTPPIIKNGRALVPIRAIIEALGGTISWNGTTQKVTVSLGSNTIELWIGKSTAKVNGLVKPIDSTNSKVVPEIIKGRTMLPLRFVTENLGCDVQWDGTTQTITIRYKG